MSTAELNQSAVWNTADKFLRSIVEPEDYGDYILPMTVLRRLECILEPTKDEVLDLVESLQEEGYSEEMIDWEVRVRFGLSFYNSSRLDLTRIAHRKAPRASPQRAPCVRPCWYRLWPWSRLLPGASCPGVEGVKGSIPRLIRRFCARLAPPAEEQPSCGDPLAPTPSASAPRRLVPGERGRGWHR